MLSLFISKLKLSISICKACFMKWNTYQADVHEHVDSILQDVDPVVAHLLDGATEGVWDCRPILILFRIEVVQRDQPRVEVGHGWGDVHRSETVHEERSVVATHVSTARQGVGLQETVGVKGKQLHALWQDQLTGRARTCAVLAVAGQDLSAGGDQRFLDTLRIGFHQFWNGLFGLEVDYCIELT